MICSNGDNDLNTIVDKVADKVVERLLGEIKD